MKRAFVFCFLGLLVGLQAYAQSIDGLGEFKLGMTHAALQSWFDDQGIELQEVRDSLTAFKKSESKKTVAWRPLPNDAAPFRSPTGVNYVDGHKSIIISAYSPAGFPIRNVDLLFKNDVLIKIGADLSQELAKALTAKYGDPAVDTQTKQVTCTFVYTGASQQKTEVTERLTWRDDSIVASAMKLIFYDDKCKTLSSHSLDIHTKSEYEGYLSTNQAAGRAYRERVSTQEKAKLKENLDAL